MVTNLRKGMPIDTLLGESLDLSEPKAEPDVKAIDGSLKRKPIIELVNLDSDLAIIQAGGTGAAQYSLKENFVRVSRLVVLHTWEGTTLNYDKFAAGDAGGSDTLAVGLQIFVDEQPLLPERITSTKGYMKYAYDTNVVIDTLGVTKKVYFTSRFSFSKFMGGDDGIDLTKYNIRVEGDAVEAGVNRGIVNYGDVFTWAFEGWSWDR